MNQLEVKHLSLSYGKQSVVSNVSFAVTKGSITGLIGPNGAGKSSILKVLAGLVYPESGEVYFNHKKIDFKALKTHTGFHIDSPSFYPFLSALENLNLLMRMNSLKTNLQDLLDKVGLSNVGNKKVKHYSTGMKQRLAIAQTLLRSPDVLVLDEPFNGLDPNGFQDLMNLLNALNKEGITIVVSSHLLNELEQLATHFILLNKGKVALDITKTDLQQMNNTVQLEFDSSVNVDCLEILDQYHTTQLTPNAFEVKLSNDKLSDLVKNLVDKDCVPTRVNTLTLLQQKYLELTA